MTDQGKKLPDEDTIYIKVTKNGPYLVYGSPKVKQEYIVPNEQGASWEYQDGKSFPVPEGKPVALCRCGHSKTPPFCDGSHLHNHFDGTETASHEPILDNAKAYEGPNYTLLDNEKYCAFARFCDAFGQVWNLVEEGDATSDKLALRETFHCPAGRLMIKKNGSEQLLEPELEKEIGVLEDTAIQCSGPLYVKGGIRVEGEDGKSYEIRNRQTLCRCGRSSNKPFCDGSHASVKYQDGLDDEE